MNVAKQTGRERLSLSRRLRERIARAGPISFHDWMQAALYDPDEGYYCRSDRQRWGREGDYRTSPERSRLFAATFARYFAKLHELLGEPGLWTLVEAGAGAGDFAFGVMETLSGRFPRVFSATRYVIDEPSADSREKARAQLGRFANRIQFSQLDQLETNGPRLIFANELLDAFPVHRVTVNNGELYEFYVGIGDSGRFEWVQGAPSTPRLGQYLARAQIKLAAGQTAEINLGLEDWLALARAKLSSGFIITVDYGAEAPGLYGPSRPQGTLRAFHRHQLVEDVLDRPGEQDLTATVDWDTFRRVGQDLGLELVTFTRLDQFLIRNGLLEHLEELTAGAPEGTETARLRASAREMILPGGMASSFQVLVHKTAVPVVG